MSDVLDAEHRDDDVPNRVYAMLDSEDRADLLNREGWAVGSVAMLEDAEERRRLEDCAIELFNDEGAAGVFTGVRFMWADESVEYDVEEPWEGDEGYQEAYAYGTCEAYREARDAGTSGEKWVVVEYDDPDDPYVPRPGVR